MADNASISRPPSITRNVNVEILRIIAAFGIVAYHASAPAKDIPYAGLIVFLALSPLVDAKFNWSKVRPVKSLAKVLLVPWIFWLIVYAIANVAFHKPPLPGGLSLASVLYGSSPHLWFLPFIFVALCAIGLLKQVCSGAQVFWLAVAATAAILITSGTWRPQAILWSAPYAQWSHAAAAIFAGLALGLYRPSIKFAWGGIAIMAIALAACASYQLIGMSLTYPIGLIAVAIAMFAPERFAAHEQAIRALSQCMFGVYLVHILAIAVVNKLMPVNSYPVAVAIFAACFIGVFAVRKVLPQTKLVLG
jgi:fucose 4-O-acetylase-like acetyltransferase